MEKKKILFAIGTNSPLASDRVIWMKARVFGLFGDDVRFTFLVETDPIGIVSPKFTNCVGIAFTTMPLEEIKAIFKEIEKECEDTKEKRRNNLIEMDIDILEYDGVRYHEKDWSRPYIIDMVEEAEILKNEMI
ncbi:MAG: 2-amino-4-hydroxy-6-hydroxymethyldihydropteridine diphosphokinase [Prevotella sp.]|nr:2-amino-4-hydroxy-6-hydroxymethyldihydropteridine diphosphokinase [Prevotella sp.]